MRALFSAVLFGALAAAGCATSKAPAPPTAGPPGNRGLIVTPETALVGRVVLVDATARCAVLSFPLGRMPAVDQPLNLYRRGLKVGEVKITGPQRETNVVADLIAGEAEVGDEARNQ